MSSAGEPRAVFTLQHEHHARRRSRGPAPDLLRRIAMIGVFVHVGRPNGKGSRVKSGLPAYVILGNGCWEWVGAKMKNGYGRFNDGLTTRFAHRVIYERVRGKIPEGFQVDHLCRNRACVNQDHLEAISQAENIHRSFVARARPDVLTHCARGHLRTEANLCVEKTGDIRCRQCRRDRAGERARASIGVS